MDMNQQSVSKLADFKQLSQLHIWPDIDIIDEHKKTSTPTLHTSVHMASLDERLCLTRGSVPWMATGHGFNADIWSNGTTVLEMATASHPPRPTASLR